MDEFFTLTHGELTIPCCVRVDACAPVARLVLGVHGFGGSMEDKIQCDLAEEMALFNAAAFRFDLPAHGRSPVEELTLSGCRDSLLAVAREARRRYPQVADLCIFATGFGAYVTLLELPQLLELPGRVRLVIQTPSVRMDETLLAMTGLTQATLRALDRYVIGTPRPMDVTYRFYKELRDNTVMAEAPLPMLILHGQADNFIRQEDIRLFYECNEGSELVIIPGASHRFLEDGAWDMVVDLTRDWFEFQQVLLM